MNIESSKSLRLHNSFGFDISAEFFTHAASTEQLAEALEWSRGRSIPTTILGGGSNSVFTGNVAGLVIHIAIPGIATRPGVDNLSVELHIGAGENWHQLVVETLQRKYYGLENLALIPGYAGAAPIQNIGAYGRELSEVLSSVEVLHRATGEQAILTTNDCDFGYRHSVFKTPAGRDFVVTAINLQLSVQNQPEISYKALQDTLADNGINNPDCEQVFDTVCRIRQSKLPDPKHLGNAGSFFKNPLIKRQQLDALLATNADIPHFDAPDSRYKIPAAWLIDRAGWKGHRSGPVGVHQQQALVLVNHGGGNGQQIAILAEQIREDIQQRFGITLEREPILY